MIFKTDKKLDQIHSELQALRGEFRYWKDGLESARKGGGPVLNTKVQDTFLHQHAAAEAARRAAEPCNPADTLAPNEKPSSVIDRHAKIAANKIKEAMQEFTDATGVEAIAECKMHSRINTQDEGYISFGRDKFYSASIEPLMFAVSDKSKKEGGV